jgi:outer membrane lipoprotein carrier protein
MRKVMMAVALVGIAGLIAIVAQNQITEDKPAGAAVDTPQAAAPIAMQPAPPAAPAPVTDTPATPASRPYTPVPNTITPEPVEQTATGADVLRRASAAYNNVKSLRADFTQKRENPILGSTTVSRGTLYQKRPDRFLMKFSDPAGDVIVSDGRYFWLYYPSADAKQVLRAPASSNAAGGVDLQAQFLGDPLRRFTHTYHGTESVNGRKTHVITMVPKENVGYRSLKVWVDAQDALVRRFVLTESNGVVQEITLFNLAVNPTLSNSLFEFTPPANAKVIGNP